MLKKSNVTSWLFPTDQHKKSAQQTFTMAARISAVYNNVKSGLVNS